MTRAEELQQIFEKIPWINLSVFAEKIGMDRKNFTKYVTGKLTVTEKTYDKIIAGLAECKNELP